MNEKDDVLVKTRPLLEIVKTSWGDFLSSDIKESEIELFRKHERNGRSLGNTTFVKQLETILDQQFSVNFRVLDFKGFQAFLKL